MTQFITPDLVQNMLNNITNIEIDIADKVINSSWPSIILIATSIILTKIINQRYGSAIYHFIYFSFLGIILFIFSVKIFFNPLADIGLYALYKLSYKWTGSILMRTRRRKYLM